MNVNLEVAMGHLQQNRDKYLALLATECREQDKGDTRYKQLRCMIDTDRIRLAAAVHSTGTGRRVDLTYPVDPAHEVEEYILHVQGYVTGIVLPPILNQNQVPKNPRQAAQSVTLSGIGCDEFEKDVQASLEIYQYLASHLPAGSLLPWSPRSIGGHLSLEFTNRYFSSFQEAIGQDQLQLSTDIDPLQILRDAVPRGIHTADNQVLYYERIARDGQSPGYRAINPMAIRMGYMVEVQVGFCAVPISKGQYRFLPKLRSICVLNREVDSDINKACIERLKQRAVSEGNPLKRRVGYAVVAEEDEVSNKRSKTATEGTSDVDTPMRDLNLKST